MSTSLRNSKLIAIAGLANSGKTEASKMLEYILNSPKLFRSYFGYKLGLKGKGDYHITAFAKPLKETLAIILNKPIEWFEDRYNKEHCYIDLDTLKCSYNETGFDIKNKMTENQFAKAIKSRTPLTETSLTLRQLMQYYGTNVIREYLGNSTGINATLNASENKKLIISDLRFRVEQNTIRLRNGKTICINRPGCIPGAHSSEREVIQMLDAGLFDIVIDNNGSLEDLFNKLKTYV